MGRPTGPGGSLLLVWNVLATRTAAIIRGNPTIVQLYPV